MSVPRKLPVGVSEKGVAAALEPHSAPPCLQPGLFRYGPLRFRVHPFCRWGQEFEFVAFAGRYSADLPARYACGSGRAASEPGDQLVDLLFPGGPAGDEADGGLPFASRSPQLEGGKLAQPVDFVVRQDEELLVGRRIDRHSVAPGQQGGLEPAGGGDGLPGDPQVYGTIRFL